jgi:hypothetical protein
MAIKISTRNDPDILEIVYSPDPVTTADLAEQRGLVAEAIANHGMTKVLIDASALARFPDPFAALVHNENVAAHAVLRQAKFAVVCSSVGEDERCLEDTGVNRGIDIRCFASRQDALSWLA